MVQTRNKKKETRNQDSKGRRGFLVSVFSFSSLIGNNNLGSTQDELGLLAGPAGFLLLGALRIGREAVEAGLHGFPRLRQRLLEYLVLAVVDLPQSDNFFAQPVN